jgi:hypothetical protein
VEAVIESQGLLLERDEVEERVVAPKFRDSTNCHASTAQRRSNVITVTDCYRGEGRGEDRGNVGVRDTEVVTARLVQDERGWLRLTA